jgi:hypothetical protein
MMPDHLLTLPRRAWDWPRIPRYLCIRLERSLAEAGPRLVSVGPALSHKPIPFFWDGSLTPEVAFQKNVTTLS